MKHSDVLIVGGGPVGTILKLLLNKYGVSNILIEKRNSLSNRPRAHYISNRSMEVLRHLGHVDRLYQKIISPLERWRYISYVNDVASFPRVTRDCFSEYYTYGTTYYDPYSPCKVGNLGQNVLSLVLNGLLSDDISRLEVDCGFRLPLSVRSAIDNCRLVIPSDINFGTRLLSYELSDDRVVATVDNGNEIYKINCKYLIGADGIKSSVKKGMGIVDEYIDGYRGYYVAIHIESDELKRMQEKMPFILKFICGKSVAVLVWYHDSEFVLHIPCMSRELQATFDFEKCVKVVSEVIKVDFTIKNYTFWVQNMSIAGSLIDKSGRVVLVGDAAHQLIPSGGFGMNLGINDVYSLYWRIHYLLNSNVTDYNRRIIMQSYARERLLVAKYAIKVAGEAYRAGGFVPSLMGYNISLAKNFVTSASLYTSVDNVDRMLKVGTRLINYFSSRPIINNIISQNAKKFLTADNCPFRLTYPAADLNYKFIYNNNNNQLDMKQGISLVKSSLNVRNITRKGNSRDSLTRDNTNLLENYYKMMPHGLKVPKYAWKCSPSNLVGRRIPHFWVYYEVTDPADKDRPDRQVVRLSTVDFTSICDRPAFVYLTFSQEVNNTERVGDSISERHLTSDFLTRKLQLTECTTLLHVNWVTDRLLGEHRINIRDDPLRVTNSSGTNLIYEHYSRSNNNNKVLSVFSSGHTLDQFKIHSEVKSHLGVGVVIRPDGVIVDVIY